MLRVTAADDRSPFVVSARGLTIAEQTRLTAAAHRAGLARLAAGWQASHAGRVVALFQDLAWDVAPEGAAERGLESAWAAALAVAEGVAWEAPGETLVRSHGCTLYPYQEIGTRRLAMAPGGFLLADAPGLGKTLQVLAALPEGAAINIVCPRNAVSTWEDEIARWRPDLAVRKLKTRRSATPAQSGEAVIGTLESLPELTDVSTVAAGAVLVCDEAHALKGASAQAARFATWSEGVRAVRGAVWLLTGTPALNADPVELWRLLDACGRAYDTLGPEASLRGTFGHTVSEAWVPRRKRGGGLVAATVAKADLASVDEASVADLQTTTCERVERIVWTGEHAAWVDEALSRAVLRRTKESVFTDMPPVLQQVLRVHVPRDALAELARADLTRRLDADLAALERACDEDATEDELDRLVAQPAVATARRLLALAKVPAVCELLDDLEAASEPVLVFTSHTAPALEIGRRRGWATITGGVTSDRRGKIKREFQIGSWDDGTATDGAPGWAAGVAMTIRAASESLTLTRSAHVVFVDEDFVPARNSQAIHRADRIGQRRTVTVIRCIADHPVDRRIAAILTAKKRFARTLLAGIENRAG